MNYYVHHPTKYKDFKELGTDTTNTVRMFLTQAIAYEGIPFEVKKSTKTII